MGLAFEAIRRALLDANRRWPMEGPRAFANLGLIGSTGGSKDAEWAWRKATDGKVKEFPTTSTFELDAGRVVVPFEAPPPGYDGPPSEDPPAESSSSTAPAAATDGATEASGDGKQANGEAVVGRPSTEDEIENGRRNLARLREERERREREREQAERQMPVFMDFGTRTAF